MTRKVLVVDDDDDVRRLVALTLTRLAGHDVMEVSGGHSVVRLVQDWRPDAVILDVRMPAMDGPEVLSRLRANPQTSSVPVVFLTAGARQSELSALAALGAQGVLDKPFDPVELSDRLHQLLGWQ